MVTVARILIVLWTVLRLVWSMFKQKGVHGLSVDLVCVHDLSVDWGMCS